MPPSNGHHIRRRVATQAIHFADLIFQRSVAFDAVGIWFRRSEGHCQRAPEGNFVDQFGGFGRRVRTYLAASVILIFQSLLGSVGQAHPGGVAPFADGNVAQG